MLKTVILKQTHCCLSLDLQATGCSFSGHIASDPESTVYITGCPEKESVDITLMSKKVDWTSHLLPSFSQF